MRPTVTALVDQADAAAGDSARIMHAAGEHLDAQIHHDHPGPVTRTVLQRMHAAILTAAISGHRTLCPHLSYTAPAAAVGVACAPGRLRCAPCGASAARGIKGTAEDRRCDHCKRVRTAIHPRVVLLPAVVVDIGGAPTCIPPSQVHFGLCPSCHRKDTA